MPVVNNGVRTNRGWVFLAFVLPLLHLCLCVAIAFASPSVGLEPIIRIDLPFSLLLLAVVGWGSPHLLIWFGILGTLWWYLLIRFVQIEWSRLIGFMRKRRGA